MGVPWERDKNKVSHGNGKGDNVAGNEITPIHRLTEKLIPIDESAMIGSPNDKLYCMYKRTCIRQQQVICYVSHYEANY